MARLDTVNAIEPSGHASKIHRASSPIPPNVIRAQRSAKKTDAESPEAFLHRRVGQGQGEHVVEIAATRLAHWHGDVGVGFLHSIHFSLLVAAQRENPAISPLRSGARLQIPPQRVPVT